MALTKGHCKSCCWWSDEPLFEWHSNLRTCKCPAFIVGSDWLYRAESVPDDVAAIEVDEGWGLATGPCFGCVYWESKEATEMLDDHSRGE